MATDNETFTGQGEEQGCHSTLLRVARRAAVCLQHRSLAGLHVLSATLIKEWGD